MKEITTVLRNGTLSETDHNYSAEVERKLITTISLYGRYINTYVHYTYIICAYIIRTLYVRTLYVRYIALYVPYMYIIRVLYVRTLYVRYMYVVCTLYVRCM